MDAPQGYRLKRAAEIAANRLGLELGKASDPYREIGASTHLSDTTSHLLQFALHRGQVDQEIILVGESDRAFVHYSGAISHATRKPVESLYVYSSTRGKRLAITWGYPESLGVLEVLDIDGSMALQELTGVTREIGGRSGVIYHTDVPQPKPFEGVAQFRADDFPTLYRAIDTLLKKR